MSEKANEPDDLEQVAYKGDLALLNECLKTRPVLVARRPRRFLEAANFTREQLLEQIKKDAQEIKATPFEPWILELDGKRRLPVFSSRPKLQNFAAKISQNMDKVFSLVGGEGLLREVIHGLEIDFVDLNLFSEKSWEIDIQKKLEQK